MPSLNERDNSTIGLNSHVEGVNVASADPQGESKSAKPTRAKKGATAGAKAGQAPLAEGEPSNELLEQLAREHFGVVTLELRHMDRLDNYDMGVGNMRRALRAAYKAGFAAARG